MSAVVYSWADAVNKQCKLKDEYEIAKFKLMTAKLQRISIDADIKLMEIKLEKLQSQIRYNYD